MKRLALGITIASLASVMSPANAAILVQLPADVSHGDIFLDEQMPTLSVSTSTASPDNAMDVIGNTIANYAAMLPEPSEWVLLVAGFGIIGYAMRSRKRAHVSFN